MNRTQRLLGCTLDEAKSHIESQFTNGISWRNRHTWDIDHIVPLSAFDIMDPEEQLLAFNWKNIRPLRNSENRAKKDKIIFPLPSWLPPHIALRILARRNLLPSVDGTSGSERLMRVRMTKTLPKTLTACL